MSTEKRKPRGQQSPAGSIVSLAWWQARQTWSLLLVAGLGILVAVVLVCVVPFYEQVALSSGLREMLSGSSANSQVNVHSSAHQISVSAIQQVSAKLDTEMQGHLRQYLAPGDIFSVSEQVPYAKITGGYGGKPDYDAFALVGAPMQNAPAHAHLLAGRWPARSSAALEAVVTQQTEQDLHLHIGSVLYGDFKFVVGFNDSYYGIYGQDYRINLPITVVGLVALPGNDPFWHGEALRPAPLALTTGASEPPTRYPALVSNGTLVSVLRGIMVRQMQQFSAQTQQSQSGDVQEALVIPLNLNWYYTLDTSRFEIGSLQTLSGQLNQVLRDLENQPVAPPYVEQTAATGPLNLIAGYSTRVSVIQVPVSSLAYLVVAMLLFFVSIMVDLLVERQEEAITLLRSRGASRKQIFSALSVQSALVALIGLLAGPFLAIWATGLLVRTTLGARDQAFLALLTSQPWQSMWSVRWPALITAGLAVLVMSFAIYQALKQNVLNARREAARSTRRPFWARLRLDMVATIVALVGFGFSIYLNLSGLLDAHTRVLVLPLTTLVGALFFMLACVLLLLRFFPWLLRLLTRLVARRRDAAPLLAVAQMARAPRQSLRMALLLALAVAFTIFTLSFGASQAARIPDVAAFQVGGDFAGTFPTDAGTGNGSVQYYTRAYDRLPGVTSTTVGYASSVTPAQQQNGPALALRAVDSGTYAHTVYWTAQDGTGSIESLMAQLKAQYSSSLKARVVPAIVDSAAWQTLNLSPGQRFSVTDSSGSNNTVTMIALAEVAHIPSISDSAASSGTLDNTFQGGILVDYQTYADVSLAVNSAGISPTNVWLRTSDAPDVVSSVRQQLLHGGLHLDNLDDRRAMIAELSVDPLSQALLGVVAISVATAIILAVIGNLALSWVAIRKRLVGFALLRALGSTQRQVAGVLTWEQGLVYAAAIVAGALFGGIVSLLALPSLIFTSTPYTGQDAQVSSGQFYLMQVVPAAQTAIPVVLVGLTLATLTVLCALALGMAVRAISQPALSQLLRLNED